MPSTPLLAAVVVVQLLSGAAFASPVADDRTAAPYFVVPGVDPRLDPLPLREVTVHAEISGVVAAVSLTQLWENTGATPLDATWVFPLSTRAAVHALEMRVGGRRIVATIKEKEDARRVFEEAKKQGIRAALLEESRPNVFSSRVANVQPGEVIEVELSYVELLRPTDGTYALVVPRVVGPRYVSPREAFPDLPWSAIGDEGAAPAPPALHAWPITVSLGGGLPVQWAHSSTHPIALTRDGDRVEVELIEPEPDASRDFVLEYALGGDALESGVLVAPDEDGEGGHFLALIEPPERVAPEAITRREHVFIVDTSGSMGGWPIESAVALVEALVGELDTHERFNVITFAGDSRHLAAHSLPATESNKQRAREFLRQAGSGGGTELLGALEHALSAPPVEGVARTFVLVTDGYVTVEARAIDLIRERANDASVFAVGVGPNVNRHLLEAVAHAGHGEVYQIRNHAEREAVGEVLLDDVRAPVLTRIALAFDGFDAYDVEPRSVPTLYRARPLLVSGRYRGVPRGAVIVSGDTATGRWRSRSEIAGGERHPAVPLLWARERIARLSDFAGARDAPDHRAEVTALGLAYALVTPYTSFVAVDSVGGPQEQAAVVASERDPLDASVLGLSGTGVGGGGCGGCVGFGGGSGLIEGLKGQVDTGGGLGGGDGKDGKRDQRRLKLTVLTLPQRAPAEGAVVVAFRKRLAVLRRCLAASPTPVGGVLEWNVVAGLDGKVSRVTRATGRFEESSARCVERMLARVALPPSPAVRILRLRLDLEAP